MSFFEKQWKSILGVAVILIVIGLGLTIKTTMNISKEKKAQENFFLIEKKYSDYKTKKTQPVAEAKDAKIKVAPVDLSGDLAGIKKDFESFLSTDANSKAGQMAALYYAEILLEEKNVTQAYATLDKAQNKDSGLVNTLVQQQLGQVLADMDKCSEAIAVWQKVLDRKQASFLHNEVRIQQALCYQKTNDLKKAEELLTNVANQKPEAGQMGQENSSVKEAARYLRLIQYKKVSGT